MSNEKFAEGKAIMQNQVANSSSWANMANDDVPMGPNSAAATYKGKTYLPGASSWAAKQATIEKEASAERAMTPNSISESNMEDIERSKRSYNRYRERMGLPPRANKTPSRERRRRNYEKRKTARRQSPRRRSSRSRSPRRRSSRSRSPRSQSPRRRSRSPSPKRRYGVGRKYVAAPGFGSRRKPSPKPRYSRRRSPSVNEFGRNMTRNYGPRRRGSRNASPLRYTVTNNGYTVNEFGRDIPVRRQGQGPRFNTRRQRRPIHVFDEKTKTYKPANWNV